MDSHALVGNETFDFISEKKNIMEQSKPCLWFFTSIVDFIVSINGKVA